MRTLDLPETFYAASITATELMLPATWETALETGLTEGMTVAEADLVGQFRLLYGELALASPDVEYRLDHDALEAGVGPCDCRLYTFVEYGSQAIH